MGLPTVLETNAEYPQAWYRLIRSAELARSTAYIIGLATELA